MAKANFGLEAKQSAVQELKQRLLFVLLGLFIYRLGAHIPVPGLDPHRLAHFFEQHKGSMLGLFNMFSGGALSRLTLFALGIMPYISASIIMQLFSSINPKLEQLKKEGEMGRRKINQYTRYGTLILATFQAIGMTKFLVAQQIALYSGIGFYFTSTVTLVTGTMFLMWIGEQMTEKGLGNGISLIIFSGIVSRLPAAAARTLEQVRQGQMSVLSLLIIVALLAAVTAFVVFIERGQRRITVNYASRQKGSKIYAAQSSHLPLKINMAGVIPPIFASSIILFPGTLMGLFGGSAAGTSSWMTAMALMLSPGHPLYVVLFAGAIIFFCFFYTALVFNPKETADNLKQSGAFIPGIRPGDQTAKYIDGVMTRLTLVGAGYITFVSLLPEFIRYQWHVPFAFGGTSLLIIVVVVMDFMAQIQALMMSQQYDALLKKANLKGKK